MALPALQKIKSEDRIVNQVQENMGKAIKPLLENPLLDGRLIEDINLPTGTPKAIEHKLDRVLRGWFIVRKSASSIVWDDQGTNNLTDKTLILNSSANVVISIWVF